MSLNSRLASWALEALDTKGAVPTDLSSMDAQLAMPGLALNTYEFGEAFGTAIDWLERLGAIEYDDLIDGSVGEMIYLSAVATTLSATVYYTAIEVTEMNPSSPLISAAELRSLRDQVIRYIYENAAHKIGFALSDDEVATALNLDYNQMRAVQTLLYNQGLSGGRGAYIGSINLSMAGQREAERLGPVTKLMSDEPAPELTIHANYGIIQVAGSNSTQTATLTIDNSQVENILNQIEAELPKLKLEPAKRAEAEGLVASLRQATLSKIGDAGTRAIGGALGSILVAAGSDLGQTLMKALHIVIS